MTLNERIKAECQARGYVFRPWEVPPWEVTGACPYGSNSAAAISWPKAVALRTQLISELGLPPEDRQ